MNILLLLTVSLHAALGGDTDCQTQYHGECHSFYDGCPPSFTHYTVNSCGFLSQCCYNDHNLATASPTTSGNAGHVTAPPTSDPGACGHSSVNERHRIIGGQTATPQEYPWQVSLMYNGQHLCGGTLIDRQHVLTAAHCFHDTYTYYWTVGVGLTNLSSMSYQHKRGVFRLYIHSRFNNDDNANDIALIKLTTPLDVTGNDVRTACLPTAGEVFAGRMCTVTGWGSAVKGGDSMQSLREVDLPVLSNQQCNYYLGQGADINPTVMCAGYTQGGKDTCQGDSGGPLVCKVNGVWTLAGIVSWGYGCAQRYTPGVYTRVSAYLDWIAAQLRL